MDARRQRGRQGSRMKAGLIPDDHMLSPQITGGNLFQEAAAIAVARIHFRMEQMEAVFSGSARKLLRARQRRSVSCSGVRAKKSQNQSALRRNHNRSMGLKSGE